MSKDLVVLASDKDIEFALRGLFGRYQALEIRPVDFEVVVHPNRDPGCYHTSHELLAPYAGECDHALVVFDRAWEGAPSNSPAELARHVEEQLQGVWGDRGRSIVIDPEVEVWVWSDSPHVASHWAGMIAFPISELGSTKQASGRLRSGSRPILKWLF